MKRGEPNKRPPGGNYTKVDVRYIRSDLSEEEVSFYTRERSYGHFRQSMSLPEGIKQSRISASFEDGMLEVTIQGGATAEPKPERIQIE